MHPNVSVRNIAGLNIPQHDHISCEYYSGTNNLQSVTYREGGATARGLELRTDNTARLTIGSAGTVTLNTTLAADAQNISTDTTTGTKIGTGTTQKIGFFNATPVVQQAAVADATDAASTQARLNDLLARLRTLGLIAT